MSVKFYVAGELDSKIFYLFFNGNDVVVNFKFEVFYLARCTFSDLPRISLKDNFASHLSKLMEIFHR